MITLSRNWVWHPCCICLSTSLWQIFKYSPWKRQIEVCGIALITRLSMKWLSYTGIHVPPTHYEFYIMLYGMVNAPFIFQGLIIEVIWEYLQQDILVYIDNILVFFWSMVEHHSISVVLNKISNSFSSRQKNAPSVIIHCSYLTITSVKTVSRWKRISSKLYDPGPLPQTWWRYSNSWALQAFAGASSRISVTLYFDSPTLDILLTIINFVTTCQIIIINLQLHVY